MSGILPHCGVASSSTYTLQNAGAHYPTIFISFFIARVSLLFIPMTNTGASREGEAAPGATHRAPAPMWAQGRSPVSSGATPPPLSTTHTPAALGASPLLTVVSSKDRYTAEGPAPQRGSCLTSRGFLWAAGCWSGGSTYCQSLAYMSSLSQSMAFAVSEAGQPSSCLAITSPPLNSHIPSCPRCV